MIPTEEVINNNPVEVVPNLPVYERSGSDTRFSYEIKLVDSGLTIGFTGLNFWNNGTKELYKPKIRSDFTGIGLGVATYVFASEMLDYQGDFLPLRSAYPQFLDQSAKRVWLSLVRRGLAEELSSVPGMFQYLHNER